MSPLTDTYIVNIFLCGSPLYFLNDVFQRTEVLNIDQIKFTLLFFYG